MEVKRNVCEAKRRVNERWGETKYIYKNFNVTILEGGEYYTDGKEKMPEVVQGRMELCQTGRMQSKEGVTSNLKAFRFKYR